jgi:hypothetical protein
MMHMVWLTLLIALAAPAEAQTGTTAAVPCPAGNETTSPPLSPRVWITDLPSIATRSERELLGLRLSVRDVRVEELSDSGFYVPAGAAACRVLIVPAEGPLIQVAPGELVDFQGEFRLQKASSASGAGTLYVYAYTVRKVPETSVAAAGSTGP